MIFYTEKKSHQFIAHHWCNKLEKSLGTPLTNTSKTLYGVFVGGLMCFV